MIYLDKLMAAIAQWNKTPIEDEWLFEKFRNRVIRSMSHVEAFQAIGDTVDVLVRQVDESTATEIVQTLIVLARHSDTTEIHPELQVHLPDVHRQFALYGEYAKAKLDELLRFYRL